MSEKRNIILITFDSLRADHCSFMGYHRKTTPTLDKMAKKGLVFENATASGVPTPQSMFGVFTGKLTPLALAGKKSEDWRKEIYHAKTLAEVLRELRYDTCAVHANPWVSRLYGFDKGFNHFYDCISIETNYKFPLGTKLRILCNLLRGIDINRWETLYPIIKKLIKEFVRPYFLWILLLDTHLPYLPPNYKNKLYLMYLNWKIRKHYRSFKFKECECENKISPKEKNIIIEAYDNCIHYADTFVKMLWEDLKDDDPIFIIHSDHGEGFGEHGFFYHPPLLYEELIHVPLIIYNADVKGRVKVPVSLLSLAPTILELINEKNVFPSESLLKYSYSNNNNSDDSKYIISQTFEKEQKRIAIKTYEWKFIMGQKKYDELYNLRKDPLEQINLIDNYPDVANELRSMAKKHLKQELEIIKIKNVLKKVKFL